MTVGTAGVRVGDRLPAFRRDSGLSYWDRFAAVNDEFATMHIDHDAGRQLGYPSALGQGYLQFSYLHNLLRDYLGDNGRIVAARCRFRRPNVDGQTLAACGVVTGVRNDVQERIIDLEIWIEDQDGSKLARGGATVSVPF